MTPRPKVAIIVLNWNGWAFTLECLESLGHLTHRNWYVILVDNGSTDDSVERIRAWARGDVEVRSPFFSGPGWPKPVRLREYQGEPEGGFAGAPPGDRDLVLIRLPENRGFAGGNNVAIRLALRWGADWTWLLNNDTVVTPNSLSEMLKVGEADDRVAVVGCKLLYYDRPDTIQAAGGGRFYFWAGVARHYGWAEKDRQKWNRVFEPHYVTGACMLVRAVAWRTVGLLDESFFFYGEEVDWQLKAGRAGWRTAYAPLGRVYHKEAATAVRKSPWAEFQCARSSLRLCRRYAPWLVPLALAFNFARAARRLFRGELRRARAVAAGALAGAASHP